MSVQITLPLLGTLGNIVGGSSDGVIIGALTAANPSKALLKRVAAASPLCISDDGGSYTNETTPFNESTTDDVEVLPATPAVDDACYFGLADYTFNRLDVSISTQGAGTWTIVWEYWDGDAWQTLTVTDGTTGWTAAAGIVSVTFTAPSDWEENTVDSVEAYWIRSRVSAYTSVTTAPQVGQGWIVGVVAQYTDDTTDFTDAGAGDVDLLPAYPLVGDGIYLGYSEKFCKIKVTTSQARTGTATLTLKYWDGSAWSSVTTVEDDSVGYSATAGTHIIHFTPPDDWTANTTSNGPDGNAGYFVAISLTAMTDVTQQPLATQGWVYPITTGAAGFKAPASGTIVSAFMSAMTVSATNADSIFLLINATKGTVEELTWTKGVAYEDLTISMYTAQDDELLVVQVTEDGTTELANGTLILTYQ